MEQSHGIICNLERFAINDGPGIRTLVFMKGCPIKCLWCSSPHTQGRAPEVLHNDVSCQRCGKCITGCPEDAIQLTEAEGLRIDRKLCSACGQCIDVCVNQALEITGQTISVEALFREIEKDSPFYRRSNGGVTVGGGEPTMQVDFVSAFLQRCKKQYIHTAIETCGFTKWADLKTILQHVDLLYLDIKHMDDEMHLKLTGAPNRQILENARNASKICEMIIRVPVVPGYNDSEKNIMATAVFAAELGERIKRIELLPYHKLGIHMYKQLGRSYDLEDIEPPDDDHLERLKNIVLSSGVAVEIGG